MPMLLKDLLDKYPLNLTLRDGTQRTRGGSWFFWVSPSREIVRAHGGELTFEDSDDGPTRFRVRLPAKV